MESCLASLGGVSPADPDYAGFNEVLSVGGKKEAHGLARGKGGVGFQAQAIRGEINGSTEVFSLFTFYHDSHSHLDPFTLGRALDGWCVVRHAIRVHQEGRIIN